MRDFFRLFLLATCFAIAGFCKNSSPKSIFDFKISKLHGLFTFLEAAAESPYADPGLKNFIKKTIRFSSAEKIQLQGFRNTLLKLSQHSESSNCSYEKWVQKMTILHPELPDFLKELSPAIKPDDIKQFEEVFSYFEPIYTKALWNEQSIALGKYREALYAKLSEKKTLSGNIQNIHSFFPQAKSFENKIPVGLFGVPKNGGVASNYTICGLISLSVISNVFDVSNRLSILAHEYTHLVHRSLKPSTLKTISDMIYTQNIPEAPMLDSHLFEIIATSIGQGVIYFSITGEMDRTLWYDDPVIDTLAKEIFYKSKHYLENHLQLDQAYISELLKLSHQNFPNQHLKPSFALRNLSYIVDGKSLTTSHVKPLIQQYIRPKNSSGYSPMNHPNLFKDLELERSNILIFKTLETGKEYTQLMEKLFLKPGITENLRTRKDAFIHMQQDSKQRIVISFFIKSEAQIPKALQSLSELRELSTQSAFISLEP